MKRSFFAILFLVIVGVLFYFIKDYLFYDISLRGVVPAIRPPGKDIKQYMPQGYQLNFPLSISKGFQIGVFADLKANLPRVIVLDPSDTLVVSSTNKGKIFALPDKDINGKVDEIKEIIGGLNKPHGIAFAEGKIYIAETDKVTRWDYNSTDFTVSSPEVLFNLPGGGRHFTRTIAVSGNKLYTSVGSSCDVCEENDEKRASILVSDLDGSNLKTFAKGLRNTVFFAFDDEGVLWGTDMGRDNLGDNLPPDEVNIIKEGKDYGWPYCYGDRVRDSKFKPGEKVTYCTQTEAPVYNLPAHVAPLGIVFINSAIFPSSDDGSLLIAEHGSWNSSQPVGYKISKLSVLGGSVGTYSNFINGWLQKDEALGRPVGLVFDGAGKLFISDDKAGLIYILSRI